MSLPTLPDYGHDHPALDGSSTHTARDWYEFRADSNQAENPSLLSRLLSQRQPLIAQRLKDLISLPDAAVRDWLILAGSVLEHGSQLQCRASCI